MYGKLEHDDPGNTRLISNNRGQIPHSCLENYMDRGVWPVIVHKVAKSCIQLSD